MDHDILDILGEIQRMALMSLLNGGIARRWPRHKPVMEDLELAGLAQWQSTNVPHEGRWGLTSTGLAAAERQLKRWRANS